MLTHQARDLYAMTAPTDEAVPSDVQQTGDSWEGLRGQQKSFLHLFHWDTTSYTRMYM